jgi:hypothetical protein
LFLGHRKWIADNFAQVKNKRTQHIANPTITTAIGVVVFFLKKVAEKCLLVKGSGLPDFSWYNQYTKTEKNIANYYYINYQNGHKIF